eukprot:6689657-Karenia_brevis.AAC.1
MHDYASDAGEKWLSQSWEITFVNTVEEGWQMVSSILVAECAKLHGDLTQINANAELFQNSL